MTRRNGIPGDVRPKGEALTPAGAPRTTAEIMGVIDAMLGGVVAGTTTRAADATDAWAAGSPEGDRKSIDP